MSELLYKADMYAIVGACMKVQNHLGHGFSEVVYKDALEIELDQKQVPYIREQAFDVFYMGRKLRHRFFADFLIHEKIILEVKSTAEGISREYISQTLNYLKVSKCKVGLIVNFGKCSLEYKRLLM